MCSKRRHPLGTLLCLSLLLATGCVRTGYLRFGEPRVHDSATTRAVLARSGAIVAAEVRKGELTSIQELAASRELTALSARAATTGAALPEAAGAGELPALPEAEFGRTVPEQAHDLRHREGRAVEVELLYSGAGNATYLGRNARIYLVSFEMGLFPTRQSRLLYPLYWVSSLFGDDYNFTKDWFANVEFIIPELKRPDGAKGAPRIRVYDLVPRYDVLTARESAAAASQLQLAIAGIAQAGTGQVDYLRRLEEQFAQQRRYPLQLGMVEGPGWWSWSFGTRRQLRERSPLVSWIPFVSRYATDARLEPGMRTGHAILLVEDVDDFRVAGPGSCYASPVVERECPASDKTRIVQSEFRGSAQRDATKAALAAYEPGKARCAAEGRIELPLVVRASYMKLDRPTRRVALPVAGAPTPQRKIELPAMIRSAPGSALPVTLTLPLAPQPPQVPGATTIASATGWDETHALVAIALPGRSLDPRDVRSVQIRDESRKQPLRVTSFELYDPSTVHAIVALPAAPPGSRCPDENDPCIELSGRVVTPEEDLRGGSTRHPYTGPWTRPAVSGLALAPEIGGTGTRLAVSLGEAVLADPARPTSAANISRLLFGVAEVKKGESGWWVSKQKDTLYFQAPIPPKAASAVDVIVEFDNGRAPAKAGTFLYR